MSPDGVQGQSPCEGGVSPDGVQGQSPCLNSQPNSFSPPRPQFYFGAFLFFTYCGDYTYMVIYV